MILLQSNQLSQTNDDRKMKCRICIIEVLPTQGGCDDRRTRQKTHHITARLNEEANRDQ